MADGVACISSARVARSISFTKVPCNMYISLFLYLRARNEGTVVIDQEDQEVDSLRNHDRSVLLNKKTKSRGIIKGT